MDYVRFFGRPAERVAKDLLGRNLVRTDGSRTLEGRIMQTAAFEGGANTPIKESMLAQPGTIFIMPFRGRYFLNIVTDREGEASCVLIRKVDTDKKRLDGPVKVCNYFNALYLNGMPIGDELTISGKSVSDISVDTSGISDNCLGYYSIK